MLLFVGDDVIATSVDSTTATAVDEMTARTPRPDPRMTHLSRDVQQILADCDAHAADCLAVLVQNVNDW